MESNYDVLYLIMVGVFLVAGVLLMLWNRGREKNETEHIHASGTEKGEKSDLYAGHPEIKGQGGSDNSADDKVQDKNWYYSIDGVCKHGPITEEELRLLLSSRRLLPDTLVWAQGLPYWSEASSFKMFR